MYRKHKAKLRAFDLGRYSRESLDLNAVAYTARQRLESQEDVECRHLVLRRLPQALQFTWNTVVD